MYAAEWSASGFPDQTWRNLFTATLQWGNTIKFESMSRVTVNMIWAVNGQQVSKWYAVHEGDYDTLASFDSSAQREIKQYFGITGCPGPRNKWHHKASGKRKWWVPMSGSFWTRVHHWTKSPRIPLWFNSCLNPPNRSGSFVCSLGEENKRKAESPS